jgi:hypothetical protein
MMIMTMMIRVVEWSEEMNKEEKAEREREKTSSVDCEPGLTGHVIYDLTIDSAKGTLSKSWH